MQTEQLYLSIINNLRDGVYYVDTNRTILFWNKAAEEITGYAAGEIMGKQCQDSQLNHIDDEGRPLCVLGCPLFATLIDGKQRQDNVFVRHKLGHRIPIMVNISPVYEDGEIVGAIEVFTQNSPKVYEDDLVEQLSGIAMHDALTGLPNRRYLESFLEYNLNEYNRFQKRFAVLFADIDNFSGFNNEYGHELGDAVLVSIANSLKTSVRSRDLVGRWGGEEFLGIYTVTKEYDMPIIGERFRKLVENTEVTHDDTAMSITMSVGITAVRPGDTLQTIVDRADGLMFESKKKGKNRVTTD
ncbi:sensor domain-containing diguanylate cyclase [Eubacteriales bacterium OttesenSCG-928-A19]|nr:sensor domain-containing diguanylate cyclase [Eubacteriales bacterium OttesenSCG-928-A19]